MGHVLHGHSAYAHGDWFGRSDYSWAPAGLESHFELVHLELAEVRLVVQCGLLVLFGHVFLAVPLGLLAPAGLFSKP